ncbi:MAG: hypothetical protein D6775_10300 [Caldilineae bacterium]|nr:MAG: hypothetical protein D6775_10300 [Caldilineae bacterium]
MNHAVQVTREFTAPAPESDQRERRGRVGEGADRPTPWLQQMQQWMGPEAWGEMIQHMTETHGAEFTGQMLQQMNEGSCHGSDGFSDMMGGDYGDMMGQDMGSMMGGSYGSMMGSTF